MDEISPRRWSVRIPCDPEAPGRARDALRTVDAPAEVMHDAMIVMSELVTNAVLHSGCGSEDLLQVESSLEGDTLRILVSDPGRSGGAARPRNLDDLRERGLGLGLRIVDTVARRWGTERSDRYRVWAEMELVG